MTSPPRSPSPVREEVTDGDGLEVKPEVILAERKTERPEVAVQESRSTEKKENAESSSDEEDEDERTKEVKLRMTSPPRSPSPAIEEYTDSSGLKTKPEEILPERKTHAADAANDKTEEESSEEEESESEEEAATRRKRAVMASPPTSPVHEHADHEQQLSVDDPATSESTGIVSHPTEKPVEEEKMRTIEKVETSRHPETKRRNVVVVYPVEVKETNKAATAAEMSKRNVDGSTGTATASPTKEDHIQADVRKSRKEKWEKMKLLMQKKAQESQKIEEKEARNEGSQTLGSSNGQKSADHEPLKHDKAPDDSGKESSGESSEEEVETPVSKRALSPPKSPSPGKAEMKEAKSDDDEESEDEEVDKSQRVMSPPRSPSPDLCATKSEESEKEITSRGSRDSETSDKQENTKPQNGNKSFSFSEDSDFDYEVNGNGMKRKITSPPRSPSPLPSKASVLKKIDVYGDGDSSDDSESEDEAETPPKKMKMDSPPRSPSPGKAETKEARSDDEEESDDEETDKSQKMMSPPRSPSPTLGVKPTAEVSDATETPTTGTEQKPGESSSESESEDEEQLRSTVQIMSPPRSPEAEAGVLPTDEKQERDSASEDESDDEGPKKRIQMSSPPRSPSPQRSQEREKEQSGRNDDRKETVDSSDEEESDEAETPKKCFKMASPPRSPSPVKTEDVIHSDQKAPPVKGTHPMKVESAQGESSEDEMDKKCMRLITPPRSPSPIRAPNHAVPLLRSAPESDTAVVKGTAKRKLSSRGETSDEGSDHEGVSAKCVRLDSPSKSPPPGREISATREARKQRPSGMSRVVLDLSLKPREKPSLSMDVCDSDEEDSNSDYDDDDDSYKAASPLSIRSPSPPPIMSPDHEPAAIDLRVKSDHMMDSVPEYTDGPRDQKEYQEVFSGDHHAAVLMPSDSGLVSPGFEEEDSMDVMTDFSDYNPTEEIPGVINLATTRRSKKAGAHSDAHKPSADDAHGAGRAGFHAPGDNSSHGADSGRDKEPAQRSPAQPGATAEGPNRLVFTPAQAPPPRESVAEDLLPLGLSQEFHQDAYFSNPADVPERPR